MNAIDKAMQIANSTKEEVKELDFGNVWWALGVLAKERTDTVCISRGEFGNHVASVMNYHSQSDPEFCENYRKDIDRLLERE